MSRSHRRAPAVAVAAALVLAGVGGAALPAAAAPSPSGRTAATVATLAQPPLGAGQRAVSVAVPGGLQAAVYDQHGHVGFYGLPGGAHTWTHLGSSSYPVLQPATTTRIYTARGVRLTGMSNAVFIFTGYFTGDGSADYLAFGTGPHGWGVLDARGNTVVATGHGSTDNTTPGLALHIQATGGLLEVSSPSDTLSVAQSPLLPVNRFYHWTGTAFSLTRDNILTAAAASAPRPDGASIKQVTNCRKALPDGTYDAPENAVSRNPRTPFNINNNVPVTVNLFDADERACAFTVPAAFGIAIPMTTAAHRIRWITAPVWLLTTSGTLGDPWGDMQGSDSDGSIQGVRTFRPRGAAPYFIPRSLNVTRLSAGGVESTVASAIVQVTIRGGHLTSLTVFHLSSLG